MGSSPVTGIGIGSVIHHTAIQKVQASTARPCSESPSGETKK
jgi:hypothetical protein